MTIDDQLKDAKLQCVIKREAAKISALSSHKIDKYKYLTGEETLPFNQKQIIEKAKFTYSTFVKAIEKQKKTIEDQGISRISAIKESEEQITESNSVAKMDFNIDRSGVSLEKQKEIFNGLVNARALQFADTKGKDDPNNFVYKFSGSEQISKDFGNHEMPLKLFEDLRNGDINPKEVLKKQARFKSDLIEIKIGGELINKKNTIKNFSNVFDLREKIIDFLKILKLSTKEKMKKGLKY